MLVAQLIAADAMSFNFKPTQSFGKIFSTMLPVLYNQTAFEGFSSHSAKACYEQRHGEGSCPITKERDNKCSGSYQSTHYSMCLWPCTICLPSAKLYENYQYIWDAIGSLSPGNLADRFDQVSSRFENGRVNELVRFHATQEQSSYAEFVLQDELGLRYSSVSQSAFCLNSSKIFPFACFRTHQRSGTPWNTCMEWGDSNHRESPWCIPTLPIAGWQRTTLEPMNRVVLTAGHWEYWWRSYKRRWTAGGLTRVLANGLLTC